MPRPSKLTPQVQDQITTVLRAGNTRRAAAGFAGIGQATFHRWLGSNRAFRDAVEKSEVGAQIRNVAMVQRAAETTWQAAAFWLERRVPEDYALHQHVDASVHLDLPALLRQAFSLRRDAALDPPMWEPSRDEP